MSVLPQKNELKGEMFNRPSPLPVAKWSKHSAMLDFRERPLSVVVRLTDDVGS